MEDSVVHGDALDGKGSGRERLSTVGANLDFDVRRQTTRVTLPRCPPEKDEQTIRL